MIRHLPFYGEHGVLDVRDSRLIDQLYQKPKRKTCPVCFQIINWLCQNHKSFEF